MSSLFRKKSIEKIVADNEAGVSDGHGGHSLNKVLGVKDLTFMGIAAVIGAGIFSTIGTAAFNGGPGIVFLFVIVLVFVVLVIIIIIIICPNLFLLPLFLSKTLSCKFPLSTARNTGTDSPFFHSLILSFHSEI